MHSLTPEYLSALKFSAEQASSMQKLGEYRGKQALFSQQTPEVLESLRHAAIVESSESSNRIEGITAPHHRVEAVVARDAAPESRSEQEIAGYRDALRIVHSSGAQMSLVLPTVLDLHRTLYLYMIEEGGQWKRTNNEIIELNPDHSFKRVRFTPVTVEETPQAMQMLVERYTHAVDVLRIEPLVVMPLAILDLLCIHPFRDGNGRVSRLITLLLLYRAGYQVGRYVSLERIVEESKQTYWETLERSSQRWHEGRHDAHPWLNYFWGVLLRAYAEFEARVGSIHRGKGAKTDAVRDAALRRVTPFAISEIENACPWVSRDTVRLVLRQLRDEGLISCDGVGRGAKWHVRHQPASERGVQTSGLTQP
jgi:Fic family protein